MEGLLTYLKSQDIKFRNEQHEEVFTVEAMMQQKGLGFIYQLFDIFSYQIILLKIQEIQYEFHLGSYRSLKTPTSFLAKNLIFQK